MISNVCIIALNFDLVGGCDFDPKPYAVHIKPGDTQAYFDVNINDDDIYEGTESFSIAINSFLPDHVRRCGTYSSVITILDDERGKKFLLCLCNFAHLVSLNYQ